MIEKNWYVVHTKPRQEKIAVQNLERQGYVMYFPQIAQSKRLHKRWQKVIEPLFPRYCFIRLSMENDNIAPIRSTIGVVGMVRFGNQPAMVPNRAMEAIQQQEQSGMEILDAIPKWEKGDLLEILDGPFAGLSGIFQEKTGVGRVTLLMTILGQQNQLSVSMHSISPIA